MEIGSYIKFRNGFYGTVVAKRILQGDTECFGIRYGIYPLKQEEISLASVAVPPSYGGPSTPAYIRPDIFILEYGAHNGMLMTREARDLQALYGVGFKDYDYFELTDECLDELFRQVDWLHLLEREYVKQGIGPEEAHQLTWGVDYGDLWLQGISISEVASDRIESIADGTSDFQSRRSV